MSRLRKDGEPSQTGKTDRQTWPGTVKREAVRLRREDGLSHRQIRARLREVFGMDVPDGTIGNWVKGAGELPVPAPANYLHDVGHLAARSVALVDLELTRLERTPISKRLDLDRLERVCRMLKALEAIKAPSSNGKRSRGLADLADDVEPSTGPIDFGDT